MEGVAVAAGVLPHVGGVGPGGVAEVGVCFFCLVWGVFYGSCVLVDVWMGGETRGVCVIRGINPPPTSSPPLQPKHKPIHASTPKKYTPQNSCLSDFQQWERARLKFENEGLQRRRAALDRMGKENAGWLGQAEVCVRMCMCALLCMSAPFFFGTHTQCIPTHPHTYSLAGMGKNQGPPARDGGGAAGGVRAAAPGTDGPHKTDGRHGAGATEGGDGMCRSWVVVI